MSEVPLYPNRSPDLFSDTRSKTSLLKLELWAHPGLRRRGEEEEGGQGRLYTTHPTPHTPHPTPYTLHPTPYTPHPTPYTLHPTPYN